MLRHQSQYRTPLSFLDGESEMANRIRNFDWSSHPVGEPDTWPESLRLALGICLNSAFPTAIYWGSELRLFYNDAWSVIPGPRHPGCLGEPAKSVWADIWHVIEPQFLTVIETGQGIFTDDQMLPMRRYGFEEETYWSYNFTPIRGSEGSIEGIFNSGQETTHKVVRLRQADLLLRLGDELRLCGNASDVITSASRLLGEHLGAIRVGVREVDKATNDFPVSGEWTATDATPAGKTVRWNDLGSIAASLADGQAARLASLDELEEPIASRLRATGAASVLAVPWSRSGTLSKILFVHRSFERPWTDEEVAIAERVLARTVQAIEDERTAQREKMLLQEIDHRAKNMLGVSQAIVRLIDASDVSSFRLEVLNRLSSLGNTLRVLSSSHWEGAELKHLLTSELQPYVPTQSQKVSVEGPSVVIATELAQPVGMVLHELVTNSVKYGALSSPDGSLQITWNVRDGQTLHMDWSEAKEELRSDEVVGQSGFGTTLLSILIENQLQGSISRELTQGLLRIRIEFPLARVG